jgi:hypothetical protein
MMVHEPASNEGMEKTNITAEWNETRKEITSWMVLRCCVRGMSGELDRRILDMRWRIMMLGFTHICTECTIIPRLTFSSFSLHLTLSLSSTSGLGYVA